jgi:phage shock protein E
MRIVSAVSLLLVVALTSACEPAADQAAVPDAPAVAPSPESPAGAPQVPAAPEAGGSQVPAMPAPPQRPAAPAAPVIVDVRTPEEYAAGHVQGAILIPQDQMEQRWQELEAFRDQPIVLYCRSGRRSGLALEVLKSKGFTQLENGGGIGAMAARGFQVTRD